MNGAPTADADEAQRLCAELTAKLLGLAARCELVMEHHAIANALTFALVLYAQRRASHAEVVAFLRGIADDYEASPDVAPTVN